MNKINDIEIPDTNNDNDIYDEIARIPESDFENNDTSKLYHVIGADLNHADGDKTGIVEEPTVDYASDQSGTMYNYYTTASGVPVGPELDEDNISPEMFDDSEGAWVDAGTEMLDTDPVDNDPFNSEPVVLNTTKELTPEELESITEDITEEEAREMFGEDWDKPGTKKVFGSTEEQPIPEKKIKTVNEGLESIGEVLSDMTEEDLTFSGEYEISAADVKKCVEDSTISSPNFELSEEAALDILKLINKIRENKNFVNNTNIYNEFPDELKRMIDQFLASNGVIPSMKNNQVRQYKNALAKSLLSEFSTYIEMNSVEKNFNAEMESIFKEMGTNISSLYKDYNKERDNYLKEILSKIPEGNTEKRAIITDTMDSIHDSYTLNRLKEAVPKMKKIRKIEMEKPKVRVFSSFEAKYRESPYNMYSLDIALDILNKHNKVEDDPTANLRFIIAFCKFCEKYNPNIIPQHSFMFYTVYNIITLDIYKGDDYKEFAEDFLKNINEVIALIKYDK